MKTLALYNIKGGVGKTASAVNLAYLAARDGFRTLVWDLDPQGASSYYFRIKPKLKGGTKMLVRGDNELDKAIKGTDYVNLDLLPADFSFRNADLVLDGEKKPLRLLRRRLKPMAQHYDFIFLDCPPGITLLSESVFSAADALISPIIPTPLSIRTLEQLQKFIHKTGLGKLQLMAFFSMVDRRKNLHLQIMQSLSNQCSEVLESVIPYASDIERMGLERAALASYAAKSRSAKAYESLWEEILTHLRAGPR